MPGSCMLENMDKNELNALFSSRPRLLNPALFPLPRARHERVVVAREQFVACLLQSRNRPRRTDNLSCHSEFLSTGSGCSCCYIKDGGLMVERNSRCKALKMSLVVLLNVLIIDLGLCVMNTTRKVSPILRIHSTCPQFSFLGAPVPPAFPEGLFPLPSVPSEYRLHVTPVYF